MRKLQIFFALICIALNVYSCSPQISQFQGERMTIAYRIVIGRSLSAQEKQQLNQYIHQTFDHIDLIFNNWNPNSEISKINSAPSHTPIPLSKELMHILIKIDELVHLTQGRFDPTLGKVKSLWIWHLKNQQIPLEETRKTLFLQAGWKQIHLDTEACTLTKYSPHVHLDLCGAIKGYAVDLLLEHCQRFCNNNYVEWGGEIKVSGQHPAKRPWCVASPSTSKIFELMNQSIATSGNYYQSWYVDGKEYTHIIHPLTGEPLKSHNHSITSVTIIHSSCMYADALATALMTYETKESAEAWAKQHQIEAYINDNVSS